MDTAKLEDYLNRIKDKDDGQLKTILTSQGTINDVDYYIEVMKHYKPIQGRLQIQFLKQKALNKDNI